MKMTEENKKFNWAGFIESQLVNFFTLHELEKAIIEDGRGNKAKLSKQKDGGIKVEYTSTAVL
jgi:hypothetical protein